MSLKVIGLVSGGKDSLFSLAHCVQNGHEVVALANLHPSIANDRREENDEDVEAPDLDSFMFQTVGYSVIPLYADALAIPLYRKAITGKAVQDGRYYGWNSSATLGDETEDMYSLVQQVIEQHPEANALCAGAILSTYQRTRVESVAVRLGLVPLAYLWQYPALPPPASRGDSLTGLLDDMHSSGCDARIIKIASGGIRSNMSFANVADPSTRAKLISGMSPFFAGAGQEFWLRGAILGEGGEYETLALDGPGHLWKKRIQVGGTQTYEAEGGTVYVSMKNFSIVQRNQERTSDVPTPPLLDKRFAVVECKALTLSNDRTSAENPSHESMIASQLDVRSNCVKSSNTVQVFNLTSPGATAAEQLDSILETLPFVLESVARTHKLLGPCLEPENIVSAMLVLYSMEDFAFVNKVYATKLWPPGLPNPPARVTIAAALSREAKVSLSLVYNTHIDGGLARKGLHVQSRSYWAPANIGPYSQAISVPALRPLTTNYTEHAQLEVVHLAGQIPLNPSTMSPLGGSFIEQAVAALQHLWRVAQERGCDAWAGPGVAFLARSDANDEAEQNNLTLFHRASAAARIWALSQRVDEKGNIFGSWCSSKAEDVSSDDEEDFDVWELQQRHRGFGHTTVKTTIGDHLHKLPNQLISAEDWITTGRLEKVSLASSPFVAVEVTGLPRNAVIEWWSSGITGIMSMAGYQNHKVISIPDVAKSWGHLSGIAIEGINSGDIHDITIGGNKDARNRIENKALCFFITLTVNYRASDGEIESLPRSLEALRPHLARYSRATNSSRYDLVTAHSFVNRTCPHIASIFEQMQLLQDSCVIQCDHVWSSSPARNKSPENTHEAHSTEVTREQNKHAPQEIDSQQMAEDQDEITEVAAVISMRIEAFSDGM